MSKIAKRIIAIVMLIAAVFLMTDFAQRYLCLPLDHNEVRIFDFHKEPDNSLDVIFLGSSSTYHSISSVHAYDEFGFTSYPYSIAGAPCSMWKPAMKEILAHQKPKLVVVDVFGGGYERDYMDTRTYPLFVVMSNTNFSLDKIKTARELVEQTEGVNAITYLFPLIKYHKSVPASVLDISDRMRIGLSEPSSPLKGSYLRARAVKLKPIEPFSFTEETLPLDETTEKTILDFIDYCKSEDVNLLFVKYPSVISPDDTDEIKVDLHSNRILEIAKEKDCLTLNLQKHFYDIGLVESEDFQNHGHTNIRGQKKITEYLGRYIQDELGVGPTELDEKQKKAWDDTIPYYAAYDRLNEYLMANKQAVILDDYLDLSDDLEALINGADIEDVAERYFD